MGGLSDIGKVIGKATSKAFGGDSGLAAMINPTAILGTAAAMGDSLYGAYANKKEAARERDWQKYMVDYQNAYNTPAAQMARYAEAGLNPNLIYGQQNYSASTGSVPHASIPSLGFGKSLAALKLGQDLQLGQEQINQIKANTDLIKAQTNVIQHDLGATPSFLNVKDNSTFAHSMRSVSTLGSYIMGLFDALKGYGERHAINPNLPSLGRNYRR